MTIARQQARRFGTMVAYGFPDRLFEADLEIARRIGAEVLEIFPDWRTLPDPGALGSLVADSGLSVHSAHGCWGGQTIRAPRVDLGSLDPRTHADSVDDLKQCVDWLSAAGGVCLVVHPGGLSESGQAEARTGALARGLLALADHARGTGVVVCVENMPPGVHPGCRMTDLATLLTRIDRPELALALDTGHAHIAADLVSETLAAGRLLRTTHVHDNDGRQDAHLPPGLGSISWDAWAPALDAIGYDGPVVLECVRHLRKHPETITPEWTERLRRLTLRGPE